MLHGTGHLGTEGGFPPSDSKVRGISRMPDGSIWISTSFQTTVFSPRGSGTPPLRVEESLSGRIINGMAADLHGQPIAVGNGTIMWWRGAVAKHVGDESRSYRRCGRGPKRLRAPY